ncbi:MAG: addiction module antidote protein [Treponema sp.]
MKTTKWDMADYIQTEDEIKTYISVAFESGDVTDILNILGAVARSKGMSDVSKKLGVNREALYTSFSKNGNPSFKTVYNFLNMLGLKLSI